MGGQDTQERKQQWHRAAAQDISGARLLQLIFLAMLLVAPSPNRYAQDLMALPLKRKDLASNKAMADRGVLIDQVCNAHESRSCKVNLLTSWNSLRRPRRKLDF
jgi:hypothetical protein